MLFFAVIHKRNGMKLINKTIEYKLDSSSKIKFTFFILKIFKSFYDNYQFCQKSENDTNSRGRGGSCSLHHYDPVRTKIDIWFTAK